MLGIWSRNGLNPNTEVDGYLMAFHLTTVIKRAATKLEPSCPQRNEGWFYVDMKVKLYPGPNVPRFPNSLNIAAVSVWMCERFI